MQFHLDGFNAGDPRVQAPSETAKTNPQTDSLPEQVDVFHDFDLGTAERAAYEQVETSLRAELNGESISVRAEGMVNKLRQLCGGWMYGKDKNAIGVGKAKLERYGPAFLTVIAEHA